MSVYVDRPMIRLLVISSFQNSVLSKIEFVLFSENERFKGYTKLVLVLKLPWQFSNYFFEGKFFWVCGVFENKIPFFAKLSIVDG